jgi:hypothetical protein
MKKLLLVMMIGVLAVCIGCGSQDDKKTSENKPAAPATATAPDAGIPKFKDPEVQKFTEDYTALIKQMKDAKPENMSTLMNKSMEMQKTSQSMAQKLAADQGEMKKFMDYMQSLAVQLQAVQQPKQ